MKIVHDEDDNITITEITGTDSGESNYFHGGR